MTPPPSPPRKSRIKGGTKEKILGTLAGWMLHALSSTLRVQYRINTSSEKIDGPIIVIFWHGQIIPAIAAWFRKCPRARSLSALTSASRDGAIIEHTLRTYGISAVRGSSSRRATAALLELKKTLEAGHDICITPDGPRGPSRILQAGPLKLAQLTGHPLVSVRVTCSSSWRLKTWDRFEIPKPFSCIHLSVDEPICIPRHISDEDFENLRLSLEKELSQPTPFH
jgi:lysophospholipid acyltransferase (LPLAT)-like uncharacterized protein